MSRGCFGEQPDARAFGSTLLGFHVQRPICPPSPTSSSLRMNLWTRDECVSYQMWARRTGTSRSKGLPIWSLRKSDCRRHCHTCRTPPERQIRGFSLGGCEKWRIKASTYSILRRDVAVPSRSLRWVGLDRNLAKCEQRTDTSLTRKRGTRSGFRRFPRLRVGLV